MHVEQDERGTNGKINEANERWNLCNEVEYCRNQTPQDRAEGHPVVEAVFHFQAMSVTK